VGFFYTGGNNGQASKISKGSYSKENALEMLRVLTAAGIENVNSKPHITFPLRAGIAAQSMDVIMNKLVGLTGASISLWSPKDDPVDMNALRTLVQQVGVSRVYVDLPFTLESDGPNHDAPATTVKTTERPRPQPQPQPHRDDDNKDHSDDDSNNTNNHPETPDNGASSFPSSSLSVLSCLCLIGVALSSF
jgi:hypothetical protein